MAGGFQGYVTDDPERDWPMVKTPSRAPTRLVSPPHGRGHRRAAAQAGRRRTGWSARAGPGPSARSPTARPRWSPRQSAPTPPGRPSARCSSGRRSAECRRTQWLETSPRSAPSSRRYFDRGQHDSARTAQCPGGVRRHRDQPSGRRVRGGGLARRRGRGVHDLRRSMVNCTLRQRNPRSVARPSPRPSPRRTASLEFVFQTVHQGLVEVDGDTARARFPITEWARRESDSRPIQFLGFYDDVCVRTDEGWRFASRSLVPRTWADPKDSRGGYSRWTACRLVIDAESTVVGASPE